MSLIQWLNLYLNLGVTRRATGQEVLQLDLNIFPCVGRQALVVETRGSYDDACISCLCLLEYARAMNDEATEEVREKDVKRGSERISGTEAWQPW